MRIKEIEKTLSDSVLQDTKYLEIILRIDWYVKREEIHGSMFTRIECKFCFRKIEEILIRMYIRNSEDIFYAS